MRATVEFDDKHLLITQEVWNDLTRSNKGTVALYSVRSAAVETLNRGGAFMIYSDDIGIIRRFDRQSELEAFMREVDDQRNQAGLDTLDR